VARYFARRASQSWSFRRAASARAARAPSDSCDQGIGSLLSDKGDETHGRDIALPCKSKGCPVCGPKRRERKAEQIMKNFAGGSIHAVYIEDEQRDTFRKNIERDGAKYHRIPAPDERSIILTDAQVGEVIDEADVRVVVELNPNDGRRMTQSREWKEPPPSGRWNRVAISPLNATKRVKVYIEEGCEPVRAPTATGLVGAQDVKLPAGDSAEMARLKERLRIRDEEQLGPEGWPQ